jgi:Uma2 family endonuclease
LQWRIYFAHGKRRLRGLPEYDLRGADVACVSRARWDATRDDDNLSGSPELVIEVLSPSNTKEQMREKAALYLATGCEEFWLVDTRHKTVTVARRGGESRIYQAGGSVRLSAFEGEIAVAKYFPEAHNYLPSIGSANAT